MSTAALSERVSGPHPSARITGLVYLLFFLTTISAELSIRGLVVSGDASTTATNILAHEPLFRLHFAGVLIATALYVALTALFYGLFKPVNRSLALVATFFSLVGCSIQAFGSLFQLAPSVVLGGAQYLSVFKVEQLQAAALAFLKLDAEAANIYLVFFGLFNFLIGYLIVKSTFLPRILGGLMALSGLGWLIFLSPPVANRLFPYIAVIGILAEALLMLWLLVNGVNEQRWQELASAA